ncbi:MAG: 3-hydroxyacyl-[acyl-carrier-protein] dehydratase FabZ [Phycisphaerae bacterium]|nr:3-hydroxyacyl-[acyl-carrier-protein] dehydratase FabZ [Phycisphaerae bacterium]|tara:strand:- start:6236 stop:7600 length:1365 start_codon:yes stop_codon:yes gene_type:complete
MTKVSSPTQLEDVTGATSTMQQTVARPVTVSGKGLLLGKNADLVIAPAPAGEGIVFQRTDIEPNVQIPAIVANTTNRARRTTLSSGDVTIETVEHLMSALAGLGIDNAVIRLDGPEVPCGDGSAMPFVEQILQAGTVEQDLPRRIMKVHSPICLQDGEAMIAAFPTEQPGMQVVYDLDYGDASWRIAQQTQTWNSANRTYATDVAPARTFSLQEEAQALQSQGMCTHLSPSEMLVIGEDGPIDNAFRFDNEPVRHKILDIIGDLYLAGSFIQGRIVASKSGHALNRQLCKAIIEQDKVAKRDTLISDGAVMDVREIQRIMPHRYPMLLVDRVVSMEGDERATGVKNVTINEPFFEGHYPGTPIMPGVLIVEAMAQLGGLLMSRKLEHTGKLAVLLSLDKVKLRHPVTPGDQLILEAVTIRAGVRTAALQCKAFVGSRLAAEAQIRFMMVDAEQD